MRYHTTWDRMVKINPPDTCRHWWGWGGGGYFRTDCWWNVNWYSNPGNTLAVCHWQRKHATYSLPQLLHICPFSPHTWRRDPTEPWCTSVCSSVIPNNYRLGNQSAALQQVSSYVTVARPSYGIVVRKAQTVDIPSFPDESSVNSVSEQRQPQKARGSPWIWLLKWRALELEKAADSRV